MRHFNDEIETDTFDEETELLRELNFDESTYEDLVEMLDEGHEEE